MRPLSAVLCLVLPLPAIACSPPDLYDEAVEARESYRVYCTSEDRTPLTCRGQVADQKRERMNVAEAKLKQCRTSSGHESTYYNVLYEFPMVAAAANSGIPEFRQALRSQINTFERLYGEGYSRPACVLGSIYQHGVPGLEASSSRAILWSQRCAEAAIAAGWLDDAFASLDRLRALGAHEDVLKDLQERVRSLK